MAKLKIKKFGEEKDAGQCISSTKTNFNSSELGVLSTTANSNRGSVDTGTGCAVREERQFEKKGDSKSHEIIFHFIP